MTKAMNGPRPRPVLLFTAITTGMAAFLGFAGLGELLSRESIAWIALIYAVVSAIGGALTQGTVTPLAAPQDSEGNRLVPIDAYQAIPEPGNVIPQPGPTSRTTRFD